MQRTAPRIAITLAVERLSRLPATAYSAVHLANLTQQVGCQFAHRVLPASEYRRLAALIADAADRLEERGDVS